ncbi:TAXI family TRAP transporter solute-binding subunit [Falsiroseomonas oryzae]|uniref:TAXI family TRAP transporter solute-binding subunit n=1 Tax=Falsiroseomonas oryzae TaxID=2766473 RepID=UPI0022EA1BC7|nr:TAXI family TRAP transporter solute-binding subunit [Roseomonas sp. MO-31]
MTPTFRRRAVLAALPAAALAVPALAQRRWQPGDRFTLRIAASQPVQPIYSISVAQKTIIERTLPGVRVDVIATQGGIENANLIKAGDVEAANGNTAGAYSVHHGRFEAQGERPFPDLLSWMPGYDAPQGIIVNPNSPVRGFADLRGRRIALGPVGSGAEAVVTSTIRALGMTDRDFGNVLRTDPRQAFNSLAAGNVEAVIWGTAHPAGAITEQVTTRNVGFVSFTAEELAPVTRDLPYINAARLPAGVYATQTADMLWPSAGVHHWIGARVPEELVYRATKAIWEAKDELVTRHASQRLLSPEMVRAQAAMVPFHPGAARYFIEAGVLRNAQG